MDGIVRTIAGLLAGFFGIYSLIIIIRIMLTWFSNVPTGKITGFLSRITDPYLDWWRRRLNLRVGFVDFSPIVGILVLSVAQTLCSAVGRQGRISLGVILAVCLSAVWSAVSFFLILCVIILVLRIIAYIGNMDTYSSPFWRVVNAISQPLLYRVNRIMFGRKIVSYKLGIISALVVFIALWIGGRFAVGLLSGILTRL
jgi:YggT family protein